MKVLEKIHEVRLPFDWVDLEFLPNSSCFKKEIYLKTETPLVEELGVLFHLLFGTVKESLTISNGQWGDFCLETWNPNTNEYDYQFEGKSEEAKAYLNLLVDSNIEFDYSGFCCCKRWDSFLSVVLPCIVNHKAPFSPLFYNIQDQFLFYFHHTGSIGLLYVNENDVIKQLLDDASRNGYAIM